LLTFEGDLESEVDVILEPGVEPTALDPRLDPITDDLAVEPIFDVPLIEESSLDVFEALDSKFDRVEPTPDFESDESRLDPRADPALLFVLEPEEESNLEPVDDVPEGLTKNLEAILSSILEPVPETFESIADSAVEGLASTCSPSAGASLPSPSCDSPGGCSCF